MAMPKRFYLELEGLRGYAFLLVFMLHYLGPLGLQERRWTYPIRALVDTAWIAVPLFFALSGFLITEILLNTRDRERYFRTFYLRRIVRVAPLYFLIIVTVGLVGLLTRNDMRGYWTNFVYLQNIWPGVTNPLQGIMIGGVQVQLAHFWSLAVEEQFYLVWPIVIWICRTKRSLTASCLLVIAISVIVRFYAPALGMTPFRAYGNPFIRADAIVFGALLAIFRDHRMYRFVNRLAGGVAGLGLGVMLAVFTVNGTTMSFHSDGTNWRVTWMIPLADVTAAAIVMEVMRQGSWLQRLCRWKPICKLGSLSYGAYALHLLYCSWVLQVALPFFVMHLPYRLALATMLVGSFGFTVGLAMLSFRWIESPAMRLKERFTYGAAINRSHHLAAPAIGAAAK